LADSFVCNPVPVRLSFYRDLPVLTVLATGLDRDLRVSLFALIRHVSPDRAHVLLNAVQALLAPAAAGLRSTADATLRLLAHPVLRPRGLSLIGHDKPLQAGWSPPVAIASE
jgi:hypothetical protein